MMRSRSPRRSVRSTVACAAFLLAAAAGLVVHSAAGRSEPAAPQFQPLEVYIESDRAVAAYQVEIRVVGGTAAFVGVEGGEAPFDDAPFYDPKALLDQRIVIAALSTDSALTPGRHRVATVHVREVGNGARYQIRLQAAADANAARVKGQVSIRTAGEAQ